MDFFQNHAISSNEAIPLYSFAGFILSGLTYWIAFFFPIIYFICVNIFGLVLKKIFGKFGKIMNRPIDAPIYGCSAFPKIPGNKKCLKEQGLNALEKYIGYTKRNTDDLDYNTSNTSHTISCNIGFIERDKYRKGKGFPSGHSLASSFTSTFWILHILSMDISLVQKIISISLILIISIFIIYIRLKVKCHTVFQVLSGSLIGHLLGYLSYFLIRFIIKKLSDMQKYSPVNKKEYDNMYNANIKWLYGLKVIGISYGIVFIIILLLSELFKYQAI